MVVKELMVGDWVYVDYKAAYIKAINETGIICHIEEYDNIDNVYTTIFEPIPLTPEILKKNEFIDYSFPFAYFCSKDRRIEVKAITNSGDGYWCVHVENESFETIGSCDVKYVHEMQHLLRLCKYEIDLKI